MLHGPSPTIASWLRRLQQNFRMTRRTPSMSNNNSQTEMIINPALKKLPLRSLRKINLGLATFLLVVFVVAPLSAQTFRGTILGTVTDPNGAVVPGAKVIAKNIDTGIERTTVADDQGNYTIPELQTGTYEVTISGPGFQPAAVRVVVGVSAEARVDVALVVGGGDAVVTVAAATQVETTSNTLGGTITQKAIAVAQTITCSMART